MVNVSYKELWKLLIDRNLKKKYLEANIGISYYIMSEFAHGNNIAIDALAKTCRTLGYTIDDIIDITFDAEEEEDVK